MSAAMNANRYIFSRSEEGWRTGGLAERGKPARIAAGNQDEKLQPLVGEIAQNTECEENAWIYPPRPKEIYKH